MTDAVGHGRPLRFLCVVAGGWIGLRVVLLWPTIDSVPALLDAIVPVARAAPSRSIPVAAPATRRIRRGGATEAERSPTPPATRRDPAVDPARLALALLGPVRFGDPERVERDTPPPILPGVPRPERLAPARSRWSGSAWLVARPGGGIAPGVVGGQLGGSQAGVRIAYALDRERRIAIAGRATTPLGPGLREAAVGVEWQPTRLPVRIVAEERVALSDGRSGPALGVVGGVGPLALGGGFRLEAYGQAGVIHRTRTEPYADGAARATHPLTAFGQARLAAGAGVWAAAQRGASRVDIGLALALDLPTAHQPVRFALEYRTRVAGDARPDSGIALTLGTDF